MLRVYRVILYSPNGSPHRGRGPQATRGERIMFSRMVCDALVQQHEASIVVGEREVVAQVLRLSRPLDLELHDCRHTRRVGL